MVWKPPYVSPDPTGAPAPAPADTPATTGSGWKPPYVSPEPGTTQQAAPPVDPNAYKPPDWLPGASWLHKMGQVYDDAFTLGGADYATAKVGDVAKTHGISNTTPTLPQLRAQTEQARTDVGPVASTAADIAGYTMGPGKLLGGVGGKLAPTIGRYGSAAFEGGTAGGLSYTGHTAGSDEFNPLDLSVHTVLGAGVGTVAQAAADAATPAVRRITDYVTGKTGRPGETPWLRQDYAAGQDINPDLDRNIAIAKATLPSSDSVHGILQDAKAAVNQSVEPGPLAKGAVIAPLTYAGGYLGAHVPGLDATAGAITGSGFGTGLGTAIGNPLAKGVNQVDKNIAVNEALDRLYPYVTGQPRSTTNLAPFTQAVRQGAIANSRGPSDAVNRYIITGHW